MCTSYALNWHMMQLQVVSNIVRNTLAAVFLINNLHVHIKLHYLNI